MTSKQSSNSNVNALEELEKLKELIAPELFKSLPNLDFELGLLKSNTVHWIINSGKGLYVNVYVLCAISYKSNQYKKCANLLSGLKSFIEWAIPEYYPSIELIKPEEALIKRYSISKAGNANFYYSSYSTFNTYINSFRENLTIEQEEDLKKWLIPTLIHTRILSKLRRSEEKSAKIKRKSKVHTLGKELFDIRNMIIRRYEFMMRFQSIIGEVLEDIIKKKKQLPYKISVRSIDNDETWEFLIWDRASWIIEHPDSYNQATIKKVSKNIESPNTEKNPIFLQYKGNLPKNGWFLKLASIRGLQYIDESSAEVINYYSKRNIPINAFCNNTMSGFVRLARGKSKILRKAYESALFTTEDSCILFCLDELVNATVLGALTFFTLISSSMRIGEYQQISCDLECIGESLLDFFVFGKKRIPDSDELFFSVFVKTEEITRKKYYINELVIICLQHWIDIITNHHNDDLKKITRRGEGGFSHARKYPNPVKFFLQWEGKHIDCNTINNCLKFILIDHQVYDESGKQVDVFSHLLRHEVATEMAKNDEPIEKIASTLKHLNKLTSEFYAQPSSEEIFKTLEPLLNQLHENGDVDFDINQVRNPEDIKKILYEVLAKYGRALLVPGGICASKFTCKKMFRCGGCIHNCPDPKRKGEVLELVQTLRICQTELEVSNNNSKGVSNYYSKHVSTLILEWEHVCEEMDKFIDMPSLLSIAEVDELLLDGKTINE